MQIIHKLKSFLQKYLFPILKKIMSFILIGMVCCYILTILVAVIINRNGLYKIEEYDKCLNNIQYKSSVEHFPVYSSFLTLEAKLYCHPGKFQGDGEVVVLQIYADENFINTELKKHIFLNPDGKQYKIYNSVLSALGINDKDVIYYILKNNDNDYYYKQYFPYFTGIAVDKKKKFIVYYYIQPD